MATKKHNPKECLWMFKKLSEYIDNELDAITCKDIERHAKECIRCQTCLETLKRSIELCKKMEHDPVPETFSRRLKTFIQNMT